MICKGGSRSNSRFFVRHLLNAEDNERVEVKEIRGFTSEDVKGAFQEIDIIAAGTQVQNPFYHVSLSPRINESLTPEQWDIAVDTLERNLNLEGHSRFVIEHEKLGRTHRHCVWNRIDPDTMTAASDSWNYLAHTKTQEELAELFAHEPTPPPPERGTRIRDWENFRAQQSGITPQEVKAEITALYKASDSGIAFQSALEEAGYTLCRGDRRDFCIVDSAGDVHSLARRIEGVKAADIRTRLSDINPHILPTVKEATEFVKAQPADGGGGQGAVASWAQAEEEPTQFINPKLAVLEKFAHDHSALAPLEASAIVRARSAQEEAGNTGALQLQPPQAPADTPVARSIEDLIPLTYPPVRSAEELAEFSKAQLREQQDASPHTLDAWQDWAAHAWQTLRSRAAETIETVRENFSTFWQDLVKDREPPDDIVHKEPELER
jgi:hypothetical protein